MNFYKLTNGCILFYISQTLLKLLGKGRSRSLIWALNTVVWTVCSTPDPLTVWFRQLVGLSLGMFYNQQRVSWQVGGF